MLLMISILTVLQERFYSYCKRVGVFKGVATKANDDLENVYAYPNP
jgi:hypothetical protein